MDKSQDKTFVELYQSGVPITEIGRKTGIHHEIVRQRLIELGVHKAQEREDPEPEPRLFAKNLNVPEKYVDKKGKQWTDIMYEIAGR